jgi:hypothetical protein
VTYFQLYLKEHRTSAQLSALGLTQRTARAYILGERKPRLKNIPDLIKKSNDQLAFSDFFEEKSE